DLHPVFYSARGAKCRSRRSVVEQSSGSRRLDGPSRISRTSCGRLVLPEALAVRRIWCRRFSFIGCPYFLRGSHPRCSVRAPPVSAHAGAVTGGLGVSAPAAFPADRRSGRSAAGGLFRSYLSAG